MKRLNKQLTMLSFFVFFYSYYAESNDIAKVIIARGQVKAKLPNESVFDVKEGQSIAEGTVLKTADKSFVKLIFIDKSQMNLGPNSVMAISSFPKNEAGIINLVKGQIRSQVTKDYMEIASKNKSKLFIKTTTAALGVRGTDFQVNYNPQNQNTALITFEGRVAMSHIDRNLKNEYFDQRKLEKIVTSDKAVMVEKGQISAVNTNVAERAMGPTLLGVKQIEALKENQTGLKESNESEKKQYRNPLPPGADSGLFSNASKNDLPEDTKEVGAKINPNGFFNPQTGEYKLPAGSIIDLNTVNIIPPPPNAAFDPNTKTYVVPESFGKIDKITGEYKAPEGLKLGSDGKFTIVDTKAFIQSQTINKEEKKEPSKEDEKKEDHSPSSANDLTNDKIELPKVYDARPEMAVFTERFQTAAMPPPPPNGMTDAQRAQAQERISATEIVRQNNTDLGTPPPTTRVKFIFNAQ